MNRTLVAFAVLGILALAGCLSASKSVAPVVSYDFGLPPSRVLPEDMGLKLAIEVKTPGWFDSLGIDYRLVYDDSLKQREYAGSRWVGNPGVLLGQALRQQLGIVSAVAADCLLRVEMLEFSQVFDSPQASFGVLQAGVSLVGPKRQLIAERQFVLRKTAPTGDASGGVKALVAASTEFGKQLSDWLLALDRSRGLGSCRPASR